MPLVDYFVAPTDATAVRAMDVVGGPQFAGFETVPAKGIDPIVVLGNLESILTGRSYDEIGANPRHGELLSDPDADAFVVTVTDELRDALAATAEDRLPDIAQRWAQTDELVLGHAEPGHLIELLQMFVTLARHAIDQGGGLYCWLAL
jgi:hypothetical protein